MKKLIQIGKEVRSNKKLQRQQFRPPQTIHCHSSNNKSATRVAAAKMSSERQSQFRLVDHGTDSWHKSQLQVMALNSKYLAQSAQKVETLKRQTDTVGK